MTEAATPLEGPTDPGSTGTAPAEDAPGGTGRADPSSPDAAQQPIERLAVGRTPGVRGDDVWAEAGRKVLRFHLARMLARVPGVITGEDHEEVHAMRVSARRMRAAWRVFGDGFEREARRRYLLDLRVIGTRLGAVRDLDVLLEILAEYGAHRGERGRAGLVPLLRAWDADREARRVELLAVLESESFGRFVAEYEAFAETKGLAAVPVAPNAPALVRTRMPATAWTAYQAVWAFDGDLAKADLATLHELRIAAKWLRYTLEFVRESLEPEAGLLISPVVALQDQLGAQHDCHVAATLAREFTATTGTLSGHELKSIERFVRTLDQAVEESRRTFLPTWRGLTDPAYRRRFGRGLARL
jgi:CHAD domain-containing protein